MFDGIMIEFRENISEDTQSVIAGIVKQVSSLLKPSHNDWITIRTTPFDPVIMTLIAPMDIEFACICPNRSTTDLEIKFTVAQVSSKARHLTGLFLQSIRYIPMRLSITAMSINAGLLRRLSFITGQQT